MNENKHVVFVTGSRADYGIVRRYLKKLNSDEMIDLGIIVTGALLDETYGHQVDLIYKDGFKIEEEVCLPLNTTSNQKILHTMAYALDEFAKIFARKNIDLLIVLGDRYEMLSVILAAAMQRIVILHIHGGEATFGNYDEFIRHNITKMSDYHFTSTEEYKKRVIQLGEQPCNVYNLGALGAENILFINEKKVPDEIKELPYKKYFVVLFHPETLTQIDVSTQIEQLLIALEKYMMYKFVFLGANADTHSEKIRSKVFDYVDTHKNTIYFENLNTDAYHYLLKNAVCLIGNSSSGIIEAPSLGIYTINIGTRQQGRVRGNSVLDVECKHDMITKTIDKVLHINNKVALSNPYYMEDSADKYYITTKKILQEMDNCEKKVKVFYDIK